MKIDFANLQFQYKKYKKEIDEKISNVLSSSKYIMGPEIFELEEKLSSFTGATFAVTCGSGTDALMLALKAVDVKEGDEIITTPFTFIATAEVISLLVAKPVFVDIDKKTYNIDTTKIKEKITPKTKAIIAVSLYGQPCDLDELTQYTTNHYTNTPIYLIIDGAQSFGAKYQGKSEVHFADIFTTSFFPAKPFGCYGDGGAVFTNSKEIYEKIKSLRVHGQTERYYHKYIGFNGRMDTLQAAVLLAKFPYYEHELELRRDVAARYDKNLRNSSKHVVLPFVENDRTTVWAQYSIRLSQRDEMSAKLKESGVPTAVHYPKPLHLQEAFNYLGYKEGDFPVAEAVSNEILSLPMNPFLTEDEIDYICDRI